MWSARFSSQNEKKGRPTLFNDLCATWVRSWTTLRHGIHSLRSCSTHSWSRRESFTTTSKPTRLWCLRRSR
jgi:hypothetical protein